MISALGRACRWRPNGSVRVSSSPSSVARSGRRPSAKARFEFLTFSLDADGDPAGPARSDRLRPGRPHCGRRKLVVGRQPPVFFHTNLLARLPAAAVRPLARSPPQADCVYLSIWPAGFLMRRRRRQTCCWPPAAHGRPTASVAAAAALAQSANDHNNRAYSDLLMPAARLAGVLVRRKCLSWRAMMRRRR
jgi:hypothetical protein